MKLTIEAFRGVNEEFSIAFDSKSHLSIIYGENGSGKTTISDALEFLFNETAGSLEFKSLDGKGKIPALVHAKRQKKDLRVEWEDNGAVVKARIGTTKPQIIGTPVGKLHTLSRKNITKLIDETPAKRFERIQEFVNVPDLDREEGELRNFIALQKQLQESQVRSAQQVEADVDQLFQRATQDQTPPPKKETWNQSILAESEETTKEHLEIFENLHHEITRLRTDFIALKNAYTDHDKRHEELTAAQEELAKLVVESTDDFADALDTLEQAKLFFDRFSKDACPICDTVLTHKGLVEKVSAKLVRLKTLSAQSTKIKEADAAFRKAVSALETLQQGFYDIIRKLKQAHEAVAEEGSWKVPPLVDSLLHPTEAAHLTTGWFQILAGEVSKLTPLREHVESQKAQLQRRQEIQNQLRAILARKKDTQKEHAEIGRMVDKATGIARILRDHRIKHANDTLSAISQDFAKLYHSIHPGEEIENIRLYLHPTQKGSARFDGTLFGSDEMSPVACLSESHLDTLGLCLFLALQKKENPKNTIVYLDDAIASVDEAHMERLYTLLLTEAKHFRHVIITSHYQPLRFKFRWGLITQAKVNFIELGQWTLERGIILSKGPNSEIKFLRKYVSEAEDAATIAAKSGMILERIFDFLTGIYQCRLPRNPGAEQRWTLDHYKSGMLSEKKLMPALRCDHLDSDGNVTASHALEPLLTEVFSRLHFRNAIGCHYKELAGYFNEIGEAVKLGVATLVLVDALCDEHDELPDNQKDGISWTNRGAITRRLYPLQSPK
jgi:AAA15 family ATPase/GTPase